MTRAVEDDGIIDRAKWVEELLNRSHCGYSGHFCHVDVIGRGKSLAVAVDRDEGCSGIGLGWVTVVLSISACRDHVDQWVEARGAGEGISSIGVAVHGVLVKGEGACSVGRRRSGDNGWRSAF